MRNSVNVGALNMSRFSICPIATTAVGVISMLLALPEQGLGQDCASPLVVADGPRYVRVTVSQQDSALVGILVSGDSGELACGDKYIDFDTQTQLAEHGIMRLVDNAVFRSAIDWGTVHVRGWQIMPGMSYKIYTNCGTESLPVFSEPVSVTTTRWGDIVGQYGQTGWTPPDGVVNISSDAVACVDAFKGLSTAPLTECADLEPEIPDYVINITDIMMVVDAFKGFLYSGDCNANKIPDRCEIASGMSYDCNDNDVPDECDPDCDGDGIPDDCDEMGDVDGDGVGACVDLCPETNPPDRPCVCPELVLCCFPAGICIPDYPLWACLSQGGTPDCMPVPCRDGCLLGDFDDDGDVDLSDWDTFVLCFTGAGGVHDAECVMGNFDDDTDIDCDDWLVFSQTAWTEYEDPPSFAECSP